MPYLKAEDIFSVKDLVFVVTGGGSGLGRYMAETLAANGAAKVYILGRRLEKLEEVAKEGPNGVIIPIQADVTSKDSLQAAASKIQSETGYINALLANSGVMGPKLSMPKDRTPSLEEVQSLLWEADMDAFTQCQHVNVTGVYYTLVAFLNLLDAGNKSSSSAGPKVGVKSQVIITTSVAAFSRRAMAGFAYPASKAAANHLVKLASTFLIPYDIRVNGVAPGMYRTDMLPGVGVEEGTMPRDQIPLTRAGTEEDMAGVVLGLCGRGGAYQNGNVVLTDGGRLAGLPATY